MSTPDEATDRPSAEEPNADPGPDRNKDLDPENTVTSDVVPAAGTVPVAAEIPASEGLPSGFAPEITDPGASEPVGMWARLLRVAWLAVLLGLGFEVVMLVLAIAFGQPDAPGKIVADTLQKISWSIFVCAGLALGTFADAARSAAMASAGLIAGSLGFRVARMAHEAVISMVGLAGSVAIGPSLAVLSVLKAVEYGVLGALIAGIGKEQVTNASAFALRGGLVGLVGGGTIVYLFSSAAAAAGSPLSGLDMATRLVNEVVHPLGCSLVLYASQVLQSPADGRTATGSGTPVPGHA